MATQVAKSPPQLQDGFTSRESFAPSVVEGGLRLATASTRIEDLDAVHRYIDSIDFSLMKVKMAAPDHGGLGWGSAKTTRIERLYKNWLFLRRKYEGKTLPPTLDIDQFWHWHMLDTRAYHRDTARIFGYYLHHFPYFGLRGDRDFENLQHAFEDFKALYRAEFETELIDDAEREDADEQDEQTTAMVMERIQEAGELPYFLHINKNAGHTVRHVLAKNYGDGDGSSFLNVMIRGRRSVTGRAKTAMSADEDIVHTVAEVRARQGELACVAANMAFGIDWFVDRPITYFTFLRDPVRRCISYWYFAYAARDRHPLWSTLESYDFDLRRILDEAPLYHFNNDQIRLIIGSSEREIGKDEMLQARELIKERYLLAGAVERFDPCLEMLARHFGWRHTAYERQNVGDKKDPSLLPPHTKRLLREANEWDAKLHRWLLRDYLPRRLNL